MSATASDVLVETLLAWGVDTVFGLPGDGINGVMEALRLRREKIRFIQVRHEEAAAFMACGYAKWTGRLGVCLATSGPGGIHLLNGLYDAKFDGAPVLAITGMPFHDLIGTRTQQDVELDKLFMDVAVFNQRIMSAGHVENIVELACRSALAARSVAHIVLPVDVQTQTLGSDRRSPRNVPEHVSNVMAFDAGCPNDSDLARAAEILNAGNKVCILAGQGALGASKELAEIAYRLAAPVATALLGKGAIPDDDPHATGGVGLLGTRPSQTALEKCDTLLIAGSSFPYVEFYPKPGRAKAVQIDRDPKRIGLRYPIHVGLVGDCRRTLAALLPLLEAHDDQSFLRQAQSGVAEWRALMTERGERDDQPMKPQRVLQELDSVLPPNALIAADTGTSTVFAARHLTMTGTRRFVASGTLATMACALPYAIAATIAYPERPAVAVVGDGALSMLMGELATLKKYALNVKIVVLKNNTLGHIKWEQLVFLGNPEYGCELEPIDFAAVARACGLAAYTVAEPGQCGEVMRQAFAMPGPALVEAVVDPHEPPMPPYVTLSQAGHFAEALIKGTPHRGRIALTVASDAVREMV